MNTADNYIKTIVLNVMYNGKYLSQNMGHEVINLFKDDKDRNFLYLNPYGNFSNSPKRAFEAMLMVIPVAKQNMFEVVAMATGLENVYTPVANFISNLAQKLTIKHIRKFDNNNWLTSRRKRLLMAVFLWTSFLAKMTSKLYI